MSITLSASMRSLIRHKTHRFARCWQITRTDGTIFRFTEHSEALILADGYTYTPIDGVSGSALQKADKLEISNMEFQGIISSSAVTHDDLRAGRFREAVVLEKMVDWGYPWAGEFWTAKYWITEVTFTGEIWVAKIEGIGRWLEPLVGETYSRICRYELGETRCGVTLSSFKSSGTITSVVTQRKDFIDSGLSGAGADYHNYGKIEWKTGNNTGVIAEVKEYTTGTGEFLLQLPMPFDLQVGDTFDVWAGCDKLKEICASRFSNFVNFGGFPHIPGTDRQLMTPENA